ncbi:fluoride efflux transporter CrcB [Pedobacter sp. SYSU D00535]|uniref:fluoride efflux transporter CrcB n=1 Tax=Pedobacter sp. SYSU D00535 TaxID=2810308 RepID=UPI001A96090D|nr:fluoride efflux transporter CrcB [Pedobacter sp. SYSU D00535]
MKLLLVFLGGGLGSIARFLIGRLYSTWQPAFPFATLTSNFLSCVVFGVVIALGTEKLHISEPLKLLLITGFCGGFSTYSSFTFETVELFRGSQHGLAFANIVINFLLSVGGLSLGTLVAKLF